MQLILVCNRDAFHPPLNGFICFLSNWISQWHFMLLSAVFAEDKFCASVLLLKHKDLLHCILLLSMRLRPLFSVCGWANSSSSQFSSLSAWQLNSARIYPVTCSITSNTAWPGDLAGWHLPWGRKSLADTRVLHSAKLSWWACHNHAWFRGVNGIYPWKMIKTYSCLLQIPNNLPPWQIDRHLIDIHTWH